MFCDFLNSFIITQNQCFIKELFFLRDGLHKLSINYKSYSGLHVKWELGSVSHLSRWRQGVFMFFCEPMALFVMSFFVYSILKFLCTEARNYCQGNTIIEKCS